MCQRITMDHSAAATSATRAAAIPNKNVSHYIDPPPFCLQLHTTHIFSYQSLYTLSLQDVLFGRGALFDNHPGNQHYRSLVKAQKPTFRDEKFRKFKRAIAVNIMQEIHNTGGRFLGEDQTGDYIAPAPSHTSGTTNSKNDAVDTINPLLLEKVWVEVSDDKAMVKIMHILREKEKKKKPKTIDVVYGKENDIKNEDMETANSNILDTNLNVTLAKQIEGDLPKRRYSIREDEIYERQIREYNRLQQAHFQKETHDMNQQVPSVAHHPHHQSATSARLQQAHYQKQTHDMNQPVPSSVAHYPYHQSVTSARLQQAHFQEAQHKHDMNQQVPSVANYPHHQSATSARLQQAHWQEHTYDMNRQVTSVAHHPHRQSATPAYAFSDNRGGSMVASQNKPRDSLSRAYEQQLREYQRLQEAHIRRMQLQQNTDSRGGVIEMASSHKYEGQKIPQDNDTIMNTKHSRFDPQAQAQHWRTSFANPTELGVPVKLYGRINQDSYASMKDEPSKFDPRAQAQDWHMSFANSIELGVPVNPYGSPQTVKPYGPIYEGNPSFDPASKLRKRMEKEQGWEDGENSIKTMEVDEDEMEAASTLLLLGLK